MRYILQCGFLFASIWVSLCNMQNAAFNVHPWFKDRYCNIKLELYEWHPSLTSCGIRCASIKECKGFFYNAKTLKCSTIHAYAVPWKEMCAGFPGNNYYFLKTPSLFKEYTFTTADNDRLAWSSVDYVCLRYDYHSLNAEVGGTELGCGDAVCCKTKGCYSGNPAKYKGTWSLTESGIECQRWDAQTPHLHYKDEDGFFDGQSMSEIANYCRDPDGEGFMWCYTTDPYTRWESCGIPTCF